MEWTREWIYIREYPWTWWSRSEDWRMIVYDGLFNNHNAFWMYSLKEAWLWTTREFYPWVLDGETFLWHDDAAEQPEG